MTPPSTNAPQPVEPEDVRSQSSLSPGSRSQDSPLPASPTEAAPVGAAPAHDSQPEAQPEAQPPAASPGPAYADGSGQDSPVDAALRDIGDVPAVEVVTTVALHLMSAAAVKLGLADDEADHPRRDLAEARTLITALAGLVTAAAPVLGTFHAGPLRDGLQTLQRAFREESLVPDPPGEGPGEPLTGPVF